MALRVPHEHSVVLASCDEHVRVHRVHCQSCESAVVMALREYNGIQTHILRSLASLGVLLLRADWGDRVERETRHTELEQIR